MKSDSPLQIWDLWYSQAGATGISFARGRLDQTKVLLVHAPPSMLTVEVRSEAGQRLAFAKDLPYTADRPLARLTVQGENITREDIWPTGSDIGQSVILPGGEVGKLVSWWNAKDESEWRWQVEFYNHSVYDLVAEGKSAREITEELQISKQAVYEHLRQLRRAGIKTPRSDSREFYEVTVLPDIPETIEVKHYEPRDTRDDAR